jgi:hypothetical protein
MNTKSADEPDSSSFVMLALFIADISFSHFVLLVEVVKDCATALPFTYKTGAGRNPRVRDAASAEGDGSSWMREDEAMLAGVPSLVTFLPACVCVLSDQASEVYEHKVFASHFPHVGLQQSLLVF